MAGKVQYLLNRDGRFYLQLVTHWYNMAKGTRSDAQMRELLRLHTTARRASCGHGD